MPPDDPDQNGPIVPVEAPELKSPGELANPSKQAKPFKLGPGKKNGRPEGSGTKSPEAKTAYQKAKKDMEVQHEVLRAKQNYRARVTRVKSGPHGMDRLQGQEAEDFVRKKLVELSPLALAEVEYQLLYGSDKTRAELARDILDRTGHGKQTDKGVHGAVIIFQGSKPELPWIQRENAKFNPEPMTVNSLPDTRTPYQKEVQKNGGVTVRRDIERGDDTPGSVSEDEAKTQ